MKGTTACAYPVNPVDPVKVSFPYGVVSNRAATFSVAIVLLLPLLA